jgi:hypothetical protein
MSKNPKIKIYNTLVTPTLLYEGETWGIREQKKTRKMLAEMKFLRTEKYTGKITKPTSIFYQNLKLTQLKEN